MRNRRGFTLFEIMMVIVLLAIATALAIPRMSVSKRAASMQSARAQVESYISGARAIAIRNGGRTQLVQTGNTMYVLADTGTGWMTVMKPTRFNQSANVTVSATVGSIFFDARGLATGLSVSGEKFYITGQSVYGTTARDSICITRFGAPLDRNCGAAASP
jgi:prepilin-type N-terminal cleavage/methylation domain-containing protein